MMLSYIPLSLLLTLGSGNAVEPPIAPPPRAQLTRKVSHPRQYEGEVMAVDSKSITIKGSEGAPGETIITRTFPAGAALRAGNQEETETSIANYRLSDVRVGDKVFIMIHQKGEDDVCVVVRIRRRPGGIVPPAPWDDPDSQDRYHEQANAWQAFEEKGIPLPAKYDPAVQRAKGEYYSKLEKEYLAREKWLKDHTAPPPRRKLERSER